jgi:type I restriction enzyme S subunit
MLSVAVPSLDEQQRIVSILGALDDLIEINRIQVTRLEQLSQIVAASSAEVVALGEFARALSVRQVRPAGPVEHYSLPAFDAGAEPERVDGEQIQSNKLPLTETCVLVSRLNPKWERCWMTYPGTNAVASTEFVPLVGTGAAPEEVWAVTSAPAFWEQMRTHITGTTGSHQRVDKSAVLTLTVPDVRTLAESTRHNVRRLVTGARAARDEIAGLLKARDELLPLLVSGEVRVSADLAVA